MEKFIIEGNVPLSGTVTPGGNKNAALPLLAASLLTDQPLVLRNMPRIRDVQIMCQLLADLGVEIIEVDEHTLRLLANNVRKTDLDPNLCRDIRASILLAGPTLARLGHVELPPPGGDVIGRRRLDTHFFAFKRLGAEMDMNDRFRLRADKLTGADILLDEASVTGTENAVMAAVLAKGTTVFRNAASEPHVQDLCRCLVQMGARIQGIGSNMLTIHGVDRLNGAEFRIGADYLEVGSFIALAAVTGGEVLIQNADPEDLAMTRLVFGRMGVRWEVRGQDILVPRGQSLTIVPDMGDAIPEIKTNVWPAFPTDLTSIAIAVATQAAGSILFHDWMHTGRMYFTDRLVSMGARIVLCDPHRCMVQGPSWLRAEPQGIASPDIRAGMALLIAALTARGTTVIHNIGQIDRGYERVDEKIRALGGKIERATE
jgi:UDP-N-acetylglucosamine 1-carboxyvinyltransferase